MASDNPEFESKATDIIGLVSAGPPADMAAVFSANRRKTAIQALDRENSIPFCRFRAGPAGAIILSRTTGMERLLCIQRWTPRPAVVHVEEPRPATPAGTSWPSSRQKCYRCARPPAADSYHPRQPLGPQNPTRSRDFLQQHPRVQLHFTPTYSSWLNQVEIWFAKIEREVIARGIFTSVPDLARKLRRYINAYSANARPIQWKHSDSRTPPGALTNSLRQSTS